MHMHACGGNNVVFNLTTRSTCYLYGSAVSVQTITTRTCKGYSNYQEALQAAIDYSPAPIDTLLVGYGAKEDSIGG